MLGDKCSRKRNSEVGWMVLSVGDGGEGAACQSGCQTTPHCRLNFSKDQTGCNGHLEKPRLHEGNAAEYILK